MDQLIDKILQIHKLSLEIAEQVPTCLMGEEYPPQWHIFGYKNFVRVAEALNNGEFEHRDTGSGPYRWEHTFEYRGVKVFCMSHELHPSTDKEAE